MGQFLSHSPSHPSRGQNNGDLEASFPSSNSGQSDDTGRREDSLGPRERYHSISADQYLELEELEKSQHDQDNKCKLEQECEHLHFKYKAKIDSFRDAIQPHTDEGGE